MIVKKDNSIALDKEECNVDEDLELFFKDLDFFKCVDAKFGTLYENLIWFDDFSYVEFTTIHNKDLF